MTATNLLIYQRSRTWCWTVHADASAAAESDGVGGFLHIRGGSGPESRGPSHRRWTRNHEHGGACSDIQGSRVEGPSPRGVRSAGAVRRHPQFVRRVTAGTGSPSSPFPRLSAIVTARAGAVFRQSGTHGAGTHPGRYESRFSSVIEHGRLREPILDRSRGSGVGACREYAVGGGEPGLPVARAWVHPCR